MSEKPPIRLNAAPPRAAEYLGCSISWLAKTRIKGGGPKYAKLGRKVLYPYAELDAWIQQRLTNSTSEDTANGGRG
jgi:predicted DNA-binding transcriptional regulator AlpA